MIRVSLRNCYKEAFKLNRKFFHLPDRVIRFDLVDEIDEWGNFCEGEESCAPKAWIELTKTYPTYQFFREILAHEMVHLYQWFNHDYEGGEDHGPSFFNWKPALKSVNINLQIEYEEK